MAYGYTCDWCSKPGKALGDQRDYPQVPEGWVKLGLNAHVCGPCITKGRDAVRDSKPKAH